MDAVASLFSLSLELEEYSGPMVQVLNAISMRSFLCFCTNIISQDQKVSGSILQHEHFSWKSVSLQILYSLFEAGRMKKALTIHNNEAVNLSLKAVRDVISCFFF